jgi:hypothetical protein
MVNMLPITQPVDTDNKEIVDQESYSPLADSIPRSGALCIHIYIYIYIYINIHVDI